MTRAKRQLLVPGWAIGPVPPGSMPDGEAPRWIPVAPDAPRAQERRTDGITPVDAASAHQCAFWDAIDN